MASDNTSPIDAFLGFGLVRPFVSDQKNDFVSSGGAALVKSAIGQILGTEAESETTQGEVEWRNDFGSKLHMLKHRKGRIVQEMGRAFILEAISRWEPRVTVINVEATFDRDERLIGFRVRFNLIRENVRGNRVFLLDSDAVVDVAL